MDHPTWAEAKGLWASFVGWDNLGEGLVLSFSSLLSLISKVLSKGQIVHAKEVKTHGSVLASTIIDVTSKMLPSFRILAFYLLPKGTGQDPELVADSILIDVNDKCQEKVSLTPYSCTPPS